MIGNGHSDDDDYISKAEINFQTRKHITYLFKGFLELLETIQKEHDINFEKLEKSLPHHKNLIDMANYLDAAKFSYYRKKILDRGGETIRNLEKDLDII